MRAVSAAWLRTVVGSYTPLFRATLCKTYQTTLTPTGARVPILDGSVVLDGLADIRGSLDMVVPGSYWPVQGANVDMAPQGNELFVQVGIRYSDALIEWVGLGYFRIDTVAQDQPTQGGPIHVTGQDRMSAIVQAQLLAPRLFAAGSTVGAMVTSLTADVYPNIVVSYDDSMNAATLGRDIVVDSDRYAALSALAQAYGKLMYFDASGRLTFKTIPSPTTAVASLVGNVGVLVEAPRQLDNAGVVNAVVARGQGADPTTGAYGVAINADPNDPIGYYSRFGPSPLFISNSLLVTDADAINAANAELRLHSGVTYTIKLTTSPRAELEPFDAVDVDHSGMAAPERHVLSRLTIPLVAGQTMDMETRRQSATLVKANA